MVRRGLRWWFPRGADDDPLSPDEAAGLQDAQEQALARVAIAYLGSALAASLVMLWFVDTLAGLPHHALLVAGTALLNVVNAGLLVAAVRGRPRFATMAIFFVGTIAVVVYAVTIFADAQIHLLIIGLLFAAFVLLRPEQDLARLVMGLFALGAFLYVEFAIAPGTGLVPLDSELNRDAQAGIRLAMASHIAADVALMQFRFRTDRRILTGMARYAELRASTDELTGLYNRRPVIERLERLAAGSAVGYAIAVVDVDEFKTINDGLGHDVGDALIQHVAATMSGLFRDSDMVSRWGGDEFLVVLGGVQRGDVEPILERLRNAVKTDAAVSGMDGAGVTVSIGAAMGLPGSTPDEVIAAADRALYRAKEQGRDQVVVLEAEECPEVAARARVVENP
ncbi:GGDEF domain-containing protein [Demequina capsici]|uniref:GGDEF domain-containing protein n=1 Tax=Demequina capsici TaxID=3075620 RepID=A0AA96FDX7_9MICO|nr:GGDEF domain-containing protein [Demequina sp. PMTSA13]WNM26801.1 GGDEF domain-containing protein [Demequina sp. PMTSA13]